MPYIETKTNLSIRPETAASIKAKLGRAIQTVPGKSERWLMVSFMGDLPFYFAGSDAPCAMVEVKLFGSAPDSALEALTGQITDILTGELGLPADRVYVKYELCDHWGWNGSNF